MCALPLGTPYSYYTRSVTLPRSTAGLGRLSWSLSTWVYSFPPHPLTHPIHQDTCTRQSAVCRGHRLSINQNRLGCKWQKPKSNELRQKEKCIGSKKLGSDMLSVLCLCPSLHLGFHLSSPGLTFSTEQEGAPQFSSPSFHSRGALRLVLLVLSSKCLRNFSDWPSPGISSNPRPQFIQKDGIFRKKKKRQNNRQFPYAHCGIFPQILLSSTDMPVCLIDQGNFSSFILLYYSLKVSSTPRLTLFTSGNFCRHLFFWESLVQTTCLLLT